MRVVEYLNLQLVSDVGPDGQQCTTDDTYSAPATAARLLHHRYGAHDRLRRQQHPRQPPRPLRRRGAATASPRSRAYRAPVISSMAPAGCAISKLVGALPVIDIDPQSGDAGVTVLGRSASDDEAPHATGRTHHGGNREPRAAASAPRDAARTGHGAPPTHRLGAARHRHRSQVHQRDQQGHAQDRPRQQQGDPRLSLRPGCRPPRVADGRTMRGVVGARAERDHGRAPQGGSRLRRRSTVLRAAQHQRAHRPRRAGGRRRSCRTSSVRFRSWSWRPTRSCGAANRPS